MNLVQHYADQAALRLPDKEAVIDGRGAALSYRDLTAGANRLAQALAAHGVRPQDRVALCLQRSPHCIVAILGVLKAGAVYVPLDPRAPAERWSVILQDCRPRTVIADPSTAPALAGLRSADAAAPLVCLGGNPPPGMAECIGAAEIGRYPDLCPILHADPQDLAYILYTSGSSGRPKGVMITHGNVVDYIDWAVRCFGIREQDRILGTAPFHFDMSTFDIHCALKAGATLCIATEDLLLFPEKLTRFMEAQKVTIWKGISSLVMYLARAGIAQPGRLPALTQVLFGGEELPGRYLRQWMLAFPEKKFCNVYGPTETTGISMYHPIDQVPADEERIPLGRPAKGAEILLLAEDRSLCPAGEIGELGIAGAGLGRGYLNDPERTARSFVPHPWRAEEKLYLTGDLARQREDGAFEFLGRKDNQVKIMGYRIDLADIEQAMLRVDGVEETAVLFTPARERDLNELVGFFVADEAVTAGDLTAQLRQRLPAYMLPKRLVRLNRMPRCPRGKINRHDLALFLPAADRPPC